MISKTTLLDVVAGRRQDLLATILRCGLRAIAPLYRWGVRMRNRKFDRAILDGNATVVKRTSVPVISIGNLTTGGTGKTPLVIKIARLLRGDDWRVAVVSRGYGADLETHGRNDEAMELEQRLPDVPHLQAPDRFAMAQIAVEELESQVILLDDGFQHRQLHRDIDIVAIDATNPFGYDRLLPAGLLREPIDGLTRSDAVIVTRTNLVASAQLTNIVNKIKQHIEHDRIAISTMRLTQAVTASGQRLTLDSLADKRTFLFSGIGNPQGFQDAVRQIGINVVGHDVSEDHRLFDRADIDRIGQSANTAGANQILCTHKDLVKIGIQQIAGLPVYAVLVDVEFESGENHLRDLLAQTMARYRADQ